MLPLAWTLIEVLVLIGVLTVVVGVIVAVAVSAADKAKQRAFERLVKVGCVDGNRGEQEVLVGEISQGVFDVLTQGFSLDTVKAKLVWRKTADGVCKYKLVVTGTDSSGATSSRESQEFEVRGCPG